jgi:rod shape-determining protein MreD
MIYLINFLVLTLLSFLTLSFIPHLMGFAPILPVYFIILLSYFRKGFERLLLAALFGIVFDLFSSYPFGFYLIFFLGLAVLIRYMFQEGMRSLSFWFYFFISFFATVIFYLAQALNLYLNHTIFTFKALIPLGWGLLANIICVVILYIFSDWYFDNLNRLEDNLKRR